MKDKQGRRRRLAPGVAWRMVEGEIVALDPKGQRYVTANTTGSVLWAQLDAGATQQDLVNALLEEFETTETQAAADVSTFVADLEQRGLLA